MSVSFGKIKAKAAFMRAWLPVLLGLGAALLPALSSAQVLNINVWQETVKNTPPAQSGCYQAAYPNTQWQSVSCPIPSVPGSPHVGVLPGQWRVQQALQKGIMPDPASQTAQAVGGTMHAAEGSLINITGVSDLIDSSLGYGVYSLQLNANTLYPLSSANASKLCPSNTQCQGWMQFVYQNYGINSYFAIWYVVIGVNSCPSVWPSATYSDYACYYPVGFWPSPVSFAGASNQTSLRGETNGSMDTMIMTIGQQAYAVITPSVIPELPRLWQNAEFNVYGAGNSSHVQLNDGAELTVWTKINNNTTNAPLCAGGNFTGEWSNLNNNSPCCPYAGGTPSIAFIEGAGTDNNPNKYTCAALGNNTITPVVTPAGSGTISPASALQVPNQAVSSFTVTPYAGYTLASITGCGGTRSGNTFITAPATVSCTVTATFTSPIITASAGTGGSISPSGNIQVASGTTRTFTLTPNANYQVSSVGGTCGGTLSGNTYTTKAITANCTVAAVFVPMTYIVTAYAGTGGMISPSGYLSTTAGTTKTFTLTPYSGYSITSVSGCGGTWSSGSTSYTTGPVTASCNVTATFTPKYYTILASVWYTAPNGGTITPTTAQVPLGGSQVFTVTANPGYSIAQIGNCGVAIPFTAITTSYLDKFTPSANNCPVVVTFVPIITSSAGTGGTINPSGAIKAISGQTQTFVIKPNSGYSIASVNGCGGTWSKGSTSYTTGPVTVPCTVTATFTSSVMYYNVTASAGTGGTINPSGTLSTASGTTRTFTLTPGTNYKVSSVTGTCGGTLSGNTYTTKAITAACTVVANFVSSVTYYNVTASAGTGGTISPSGTLSTATGTTRTFLLTSSPTYRISSVGGTCGGSLSGSYYTTKPITAACTVTAAFVYLPTYYNVTASAGYGGTISPAGVLSTVLGTTRTFTLTPSANYKVSSVSGTCGGTLSSNNYTTKAITGNCTVIAAFTPISSTYIVTANVSPSGTGIILSDSIVTTTTTAVTMAAGKPLNIAVAPNSGYKVNTVSMCGQTFSGDTQGQVMSYSVSSITAPCTITATFTPLPSTPTTVTVTATAGSGGTISPSGIIKINQNQAIRFKLTHNPGNYFTNVGGTCGGRYIPSFQYIDNSNTQTYEITPSQNCTIEVTYRQYSIINGVVVLM